MIQEKESMGIDVMMNQQSQDSGPSTSRKKVPAPQPTIHGTLQQTTITTRPEDPN